MRELAVYYSFVRSSILMLSICGLIGLTYGFYSFRQQQPVYAAEEVYEVTNEQLGGEEKILVAEQTVSLLREESVRQQIGVSDVQQLYVSRIPHFAVKVLSSSNNPQQTKKQLGDVSELILSKGNFILVGESAVRVEHPQLVGYLLAGLAAGLGVGVFLGLVKNYLTNF